MIWEPIQDIHLRWHLFINLTTGCHCQFREGLQEKRVMGSHDGEKGEAPTRPREVQKSKRRD